MMNRKNSVLLRVTPWLLLSLFVAACGNPLMRRYFNYGKIPAISPVARLANTINDIAGSNIASVSGNTVAVTGPFTVSNTTFTVPAGVTLDLTDPAANLVLGNAATLTVNGEVEAHSGTGTDGFTGYSIGINCGTGTNAAVINGSGVIHLTTTGALFNVYDDKKLTLTGSVKLDGYGTTLISGWTRPDWVRDVGVNNTSAMIGIESTGAFQPELVISGDVIIAGNYNSSGSWGGGIWIGSSPTTGPAGGLLTLEGNASIEGNRAAAGGGVLVQDSGSVFTMRGGSISGNASPLGGGVHAYNSGLFLLEAGRVQGTTAEMVGTKTYAANTTTSVISQMDGFPGTTKFGTTGTSYFVGATSYIGGANIPNTSTGTVLGN
jgi:hypothetical protein